MEESRRTSADARLLKVACISISLPQTLHLIIETHCRYQLDKVVPAHRKAITCLLLSSHTPSASISSAGRSAYEFVCPGNHDSVASADWLWSVKVIGDVLIPILWPCSIPF